MALMEFNPEGELVEILIQADTDEGERVTADALAKLVEPTLLERVCPLYDR